MKKVYIITALLICANFIYAQDDDYEYSNQDEFKTIFGGKELGGYGGIGLGYSQIDDRHAITIDARGGVLLGHWLMFGIGGAGFINQYEYNQALNMDASLVGGYGGFVVEAIVLPKSGVHLSFPILAGVGGVAYTTWMKDNENYEQDNEVNESSVFLVVEPGAEIEFNFTRFFRMAAFISYRYTSDIDLTYASHRSLINYSTGVRVKFGKF
ncbi:MAG: hypothetical protein JW894_14165 [Bacteroidales bacterium]|nr:hypothetical protein [Bacteroidales bacterium]